ncbi:LuxR family transcriptional regulator [Nonomuraea sp. NN258]|uniref:helix-turn-helix transcriptional regulator n=1 Tax=Nonomuraea antri TaxID=2730852 RepID=UPI001567D7D5|nr:LuxR C-terminal-related transcriptional regulator [Nonomuraea antri]NRQ37315.1 LuxR family transcriptional regulator [Nonomuraea antri]
MGRADELAAIGDALTAGRVLTLAGPGGCGKTRLAIRVSRAAADSWPDGAFWVGLEEEPDGAHVARRIAAALDLLLPAGPDPVPALAGALRGRELLLVVDNCEHVLDAAAEVIAAILASCPGVAVLATSRATLGVPGERVWRVPPMALADALELLLERVRAGAPGAAESRPAARRVCDRLDRLPLALELAAGWAGALSLAQIADSLSTPFALLDGGARTAPFRQRTLQGSMSWSHDLLDEDERVLFRRLGVFEPGFTADAVTRLSGLGGPGPGDLLRALRGLIDKSLVVADTTGEVARYRMLGVVRAYALDRLAAAGESDAAADLHLDLQLALLGQAAPLLDTDKDAWRARVGAAYPNVRAAIEWGLSRQDPGRGRRLAVACVWLWHLEGRGDEGVRLLRKGAARGADERTARQAEILAALALVLDTAEPGVESFEVARAARELAAESGTPAAARLAGPLVALGRLAVGLTETLAEARAVRDEAAAAGDAFVADCAETFAGLVHLLADDYRRAIDSLERAAAGLAGRGDRGIGSIALGWLALATARSGAVERAGELAERAVRTAEPLRDLHWTGAARVVLAEIRVLQGRLEAAAAALEPIDRLVDGSERLPFITGWERGKAMIALACGRPEEAVEWCRREGRWQDEPDDSRLAPETQLVLATALRPAGDQAGAARVLDALAGAPVTGEMPRIRAGVLDEQALAAHESDPERALRLHHEALRTRIEHDLVLGQVSSLDSLALANLRRGAGEAAGILAGAAERARRDLGLAPRPWPGADDPALAGAMARGREMDLAAAIAYATRARGPRGRPQTGWESLTPAERSVAELAAQGLSNPEIAGRLFVGRGTVKTHLAHIYAKLQVANRTELARAAAARPGGDD